jgi:hypothetical protein
MLDGKKCVLRRLLSLQRNEANEEQIVIIIISKLTLCDIIDIDFDGVLPSFHPVCFLLI